MRPNSSLSACIARSTEALQGTPGMDSLTNTRTDTAAASRGGTDWLTKGRAEKERKGGGGWRRKEDDEDFGGEGKALVEPCIGLLAGESWITSPFWKRLIPIILLSVLRSSAIIRSSQFKKIVCVIRNEEGGFLGLKDKQFAETLNWIFDDVRGTTIFSFSQALFDV